MCLIDPVSVAVADHFRTIRSRITCPRTWKEVVSILSSELDVCRISAAVRHSGGSSSRLDDGDKYRSLRRFTRVAAGLGRRLMHHAGGRALVEAYGMTTMAHNAGRSTSSTSAGSQRRSSRIYLRRHERLLWTALHIVESSRLAFGVLGGQVPLSRWG
jgi:hypothetical protein